MKKILVLGLSLLSLPLWAAEIRWIRIDTNVKYGDPTVACNNLSSEGKPLPDGGFFLSLEIESDRIARARLNNFPKIFPYSLALYRSIRINDEEARKISLVKDSHGKWWLKSWELSERILKWVGSNSTMQGVLCRVPQPLKSITPTTVAVEFDTSGLLPGVEVAESPWQTFTGRRQDEKPYSLGLQFVQRSVAF